jgi:hypothetical protein
MQLRNEEFRFYLVRWNSKIPIEKNWNTTKNYAFNNPTLLSHLDSGGNYGIVTGRGGLIVVDFDCPTYYAELRNRLWDFRTFTVRTAGKKLPHLYYYLEGSMISKKGINNESGERVCDIQASKSGVIAPGSMIDKNAYCITLDKPIMTIELKQLEHVFNTTFDTINENKTSNNSKVVEDKNACEASVNLLLRLGLKRTNTGLFQCAHHPMHGTGNLSVMPSGMLHCFHCERIWHAQEYVDELLMTQSKGGNTK